jgi:predicted transcriptional regulator
MVLLMVDTNVEDTELRIVALLRRHSEGLTIQDISRLLGLHRQTVSKYLFAMERSGVTNRRIVGASTLNYLARSDGGGKK